MITVYSRLKEDYSNHPNNYPIFRGKSVLGNPYTHKSLSGSLAIYHVNSREEAIQRYDSYFDLQYANNYDFRKVVDEIYEKYKNGEDVYLECYCDGEDNCHGGVIKRKLQKRLLKDKMKEIKKKRGEKLCL